MCEQPLVTKPLHGLCPLDLVFASKFTGDVVHLLPQPTRCFEQFDSHLTSPFSAAYAALIREKNGSENGSGSAGSG